MTAVALNELEGIVENQYKVCNMQPLLQKLNAIKISVNIFKILYDNKTTVFSALLRHG